MKVAYSSKYLWLEYNEVSWLIAIGLTDCSSEHLLLSSMVEPGCQKIELAYALALSGQKKSYEVGILHFQLKLLNEPKPP